MPYADAVIKEVLRLLPPAGGMFRKTLKDLEVRIQKGGRIRVQKGSGGWKGKKPHRKYNTLHGRQGKTCYDLLHALTGA
jgi:hypothetical protein